LYFMPLYIEGLAANWEIIIFVVGLVLIAVEIFAIPGFGVAGILGITMVIAGLALSMVDNFGFEYKSFPFGELVSALFVVVIAAFTSLILSFWVSKRLFTTTTFGELALATIQDKTEGYTSAVATYTQMIGKEGTARTVLRPSGKILIDDEIYDATAESGFIERDEKIRVTRYSNTQLFVRKIS
ncbi:MAG: NfeD family protein, partial [Bacteroidales bacterium]